MSETCRVGHDDDLLPEVDDLAESPLDDAAILRRLRAMLNVRKNEYLISALAKYLEEYDRARSRTPDGFATIRILSQRTGASRSSIAHDIREGYLTPSGTHKGSLIFSKAVAEQYVKWRKDLDFHIAHRTRRQEIRDSLARTGIKETAVRFKVKEASLRRLIQRHKKIGKPLEVFSPTGKMKA